MSENETDEEVLLRLRPSRKRFIKEYSGFAISLILMLVLFLTPFDFPFELEFLDMKLLIGSLLGASAFLFILYAEVRRWVELYVLTESSIFEEMGIIDKRSTGLPYIKLERCDMEEPFLERIMGIGDVRVDAGEDFFIIKGAPNPEELRRMIRERMRETMSGNGVKATVHD